jgi:hypothetical protein
MFGRENGNLLADATTKKEFKTKKTNNASPTKLGLLRKI